LKLVRTKRREIKDEYRELCSLLTRFENGNLINLNWKPTDTNVKPKVLTRETIINYK
jgi:hypothetical protein